LFDRPKPTVGCSANGRRRSYRGLYLDRQFYKLVTNLFLLKEISDNYEGTISSA